MRIHAQPHRRTLDVILLNGCRAWSIAKDLPSPPSCEARTRGSSGLQGAESNPSQKGASAPERPTSNAATCTQSITLLLLQRANNTRAQPAAPDSVVILSEAKDLLLSLSPLPLPFFLSFPLGICFFYPSQETRLPHRCSLIEFFIRFAQTTTLGRSRI